jgi:hypothetical protein
MRLPVQYHCATVGLLAQFGGGSVRYLVNAFGIPRIDAGAQGIHLLWSWPDVLPVSTGGYDIQRLPYKRAESRTQCETITLPVIERLEQAGEYPAPLGPLRLRTDVQFSPLPNGAYVKQSAATAAVAPFMASPTRAVFIQELTTPAGGISVQCPNAFIVIATARGKGVAMAAGSAGQTVELVAPAIDTIWIYVLVARMQSFTICAVNDVDDPGRWKDAPYLVRGLTLPIQQTDPALTTPAAEYAAATSRLIGGETLAESDFAQLTATLRTAAEAAQLGRSGERVVLTRHDPSQSFEELTLNQQLGALCIHPKIRRVLGFGWADHSDLVEGDTYIYRVTGRFDAADLTDTIYDFHLIPSSTVLPAAFSIGNLGVRTQLPASIVLDPVPSTSANNDASRRGLAITADGFDDSWLLPSFGVYTAIFDLPAPVTNIELDVGAHQTFHYAGGLPWGFGSTPLQPLPPGPRVQLTFATPISQLRLTGKGTLYALRIPAGGTGVVEVTADTPPIRYAAEALPLPPVTLSIANLQEPLATLTGTIDESTSVQPRPPEGFRLTWLPETTTTLPLWPTDIDGGPPLDAIAYVIDHRTVVWPSQYGAWEPIGSDDNLTVGSRDGAGADVTLSYGCDVAALFPEVRPRSSDAGLALHVSDIFGETDPATGETRPAQPYGSYHQYQIRSMDAVGRVSSTATPSNVERLEKHVPPPLPVGPQPEPAIESGTFDSPPGPRARAIVKGAVGLTSDDLTLLGTHQNAILLEWGWRPDQRDLDPETTEFRVYQTAPLDVIRATITSVTSAGSNWQLNVTTDLPLVASELKSQWITTNNYPFQIVDNGSGTSTTITVSPSVLQPALAPAPGSALFGRPLAPVHQRPAGWDERVAIVPLTADDTYRYVFYDVLELSLTQPRDAVWVGVSAADAQSYVADERTSGANANRPGNESAIATCTVAARFTGQPVFSVPPPLGDVPEMITDEPTGRQVLVTLDLRALLGGALPPGAPVAVARASADDITSALSTGGGSVFLTNPDGSRQTIVFPNPGDEAAVLATLTSASPQTLANQYLIFLAGASSDSAAIFTRISSDIDTVGPFTDRIPPKEGRYFYFVRAADALGHLSDGGAILPVCVRVPSVALGTRPVKRAQLATATSAALTVAVPADDATTTALLFVRLDPPGADPPAQNEAELLRVPNRRDLYPHDGLRLLLSDGTLLAPAVVKSLADGDVTVTGDGSRVATLTAPATQGEWATMWCYSLTADGMPSHPCGPFAIGVGA